MCSTFEGQCWAQCVELSRRLVGVHAVTQRQLGNTAAVLSPEVVGYCIIILRRVCEGLRIHQHTHTIRSDDRSGGRGALKGDTVSK